MNVLWFILTTNERSSCDRPWLFCFIVEIFLLGGLQGLEGLCYRPNRANIFHSFFFYLIFAFISTLCCWGKIIFPFYYVLNGQVLFVMQRFVTRCFVGTNWKCWSVRKSDVLIAHNEKYSLESLHELTPRSTSKHLHTHNTPICIMQNSRKSDVSVQLQARYPIWSCSDWIPVMG